MLEVTDTSRAAPPRFSRCALLAGPARDGLPVCHFAFLDHDDEVTVITSSNLSTNPYNHKQQQIVCELGLNHGIVLRFPLIFHCVSLMNSLLKIDTFSGGRMPHTVDMRCDPTTSHLFVELSSKAIVCSASILPEDLHMQNNRQCFSQFYLLKNDQGLGCFGEKAGQSL